MKKLFSLLIALLILSSSYAYSLGSNSIATTDGNFVVAVGNGGQILISTNGGNNWYKSQIGSINFNDVTADGNQVFVAGGDGSVYVSNNISYTQFVKYNVAPGTQMNGIDKIGSNIFVCGNNGAVFKSLGLPGFSLSNSGISSVKLNAIHFFDVNNGAVVGDNGSIYITNNGGASWTSETSGTTRNLTDVRYYSGEIIVTGEYGVILRKVGAGSFSAIDSRTIWDMNAVSGTSASNVRIVGGGGFIRNNNSSANFLNFEQNPMMADLVDIEYYDANTGFAISSLNDAVIKTVNGGTTWSLTGGASRNYSWTQVLSGISGGIGNGFAITPTVNRNTVYLCQGTTVYRSMNRGQNWTQIATVTGSPSGSCHSFYVNPLDTNIMLGSFGSSNGSVKRSTNYGQTWTTVWTGVLTSYGMPLEMDQNNPNTVYLGPDNAFLLKSTNFGLNWTTHGTTMFNSPCDLAVQEGNSNVMYCGDGVTFSGSGKLWRSTNNGVNWSQVHTVSGSEIPMIGISPINRNLAFHTAWSSGGVWKSTNEFVNVSQVATTGSAWACDVAKDDPTTFSFASYSGDNYVSWESGATGSYTNTGSLGTNAGMMFINKGNLLQQSGSSIDKLVVTYTAPSTPLVITGVEGPLSNIPEKFDLLQNYPNPFNPSTKIRYDLAKTGIVKLTVYDQLGRQVAELVNGSRNAGAYEVEFNGSNLASGIYFYKLEVPGQTFTKKMILVK